MNYLKLHAATQQQFHYHIKHTHSVSKEFNQHSHTDPWYGAGQGAGNACPRWIVQANSLTRAYNTWAQPWHLTSPNADECMQQGFNTFVDDTNLVSIALPQQTIDTPIRTAQANLTIWNDLLQASGGELNPSKCVWFCFFWRIDPCSMASITEPPPTLPEVMLSVHNGQPIPIKRLAPSEAHRYLGIHLMTDGNYRTEIEMFRQCNDRFIQLLQQCPFPQQDVVVIYKQC